MANTVCSICKQPSRNQNFCDHCRYPLNVKKLTEYNPSDIKNFLTHLELILRPYASASFTDQFLAQAYHELFSLDWLRVETAVTNFTLLRAMHEARKYFEYPTLDLGCGTGVFLAIFFGATLEPQFDDYGSVDLSKTDIYNSYQGMYKNIIAQKPKLIGFGVDIKENSVRNATDLGVYNAVKVGDIRQLPFTDQSVNSVYSNMLDDVPVKDLPTVLKEVRRVLKDNQYFIFVTPTEKYRTSLFYYPLAKQKADAGDYDTAELYMQYDRGRSEWEPYSKQFWQDLLAKESFEIVSYIPTMDATMLKFWDVGFRPFFPELLKLRNAVIKKNYLIEFKLLVLQILKNYFFPMVKKPFGSDTTFAIVVAKKY